MGYKVQYLIRQDNGRQGHARTGGEFISSLSTPALIRSTWDGWAVLGGSGLRLIQETALAPAAVKD